jgi:hypothetical protein
MLFTSTSTSSPAFTVSCPFSVNSAGLTMPSDFVTKVDDHSTFAHADDGAANYFAFFECRLFLFELIEELTEIHVAAGACLI